MLASVGAVSVVGGCNCGRTGQLNEAEQQEANALKARDREVRAHEQAHAAVGGQYAGAPSYTYQTGPDGKQYAVGGEVPIDVSPIPNDPKATMEKMDVVARAALAPAEPSAQDRKVAAEAQQRRAQAQAELLAQRSEQRAEALEKPDDAVTGYQKAAPAIAPDAPTQPELSLAA